MIERHLQNLMHRDLQRQREGEKMGKMLGPWRDHFCAKQPPALAIRIDLDLAVGLPHEDRASLASK